MAGSVNKVILVGRLGKDPEVKHTKGGTAIATFSVATDETWKDQNGEKQSRTEWHNIVAFAKLAEIVGQYVKKGRQVYIEGKITSRSYEKEGVTRYVTEIRANQLVMLGDGGEKQAQGEDDFNDRF